MIRTQASWMESASLYRCPYKSGFSFVKNPVHLKFLIYFLKKHQLFVSLFNTAVQIDEYSIFSKLVNDFNFNLFFSFLDILNTTIIWLYVMCKNSTMHSIIPQMFIESHISAKNNGMRHFHLLVGLNNH